MLKIHTDCRQYRVTSPCRPHKRTQVSCADCVEYAPVDTRILIVKLDAMGDVLRTTSCLEPLKRLYPRSHVTWITRRGSAAVLEGNALIDRTLVVESNYLEFLLAEEFTLALGPDADPLSASIVALARAPLKRGFTADGRGGVAPLNDAAAEWWRLGLHDPSKRRNRRTYGEWIYAMCELPPPVARPYLRPGAEARARAAQRLGRGMPHAVRRVCFNTGAGPRWQEKSWKPRHWLDLAEIIRDRDPSTVVALVGGPGEAELNAALLAADPSLVDGGTNCPIEELAATMAACDRVVTADSLGYHVACAVGTPAVCVVGPTSPWELDLYGTNHVVHADLDCIACYLARCPFAETCMDLLSPSAIWPLVRRADAAVSAVDVGRPNPAHRHAVARAAR